MKFTFKTPTHLSTGKQQNGIVTGQTHRNQRAVMLILVIMAMALEACNLPQKKALPAAQPHNNASVTPDQSGTLTSSADAGGATLNLVRNATFDYPNGSDVQNETGAIPLKFSKSTEGPLIVEGKGKTAWTEVTNFPGCRYTSKAEGKITVTGLFTLEDCLFHLTIATEFSQPTTSYQEQDPEVCSGSIQFTQTESTSRIELDPATDRFKETKEGNWWEITTVNLTDLKSEVVHNCFKPEVIERSK
jgi:hypothetical protein